MTQSIKLELTLHITLVTLQVGRVGSSTDLIVQHLEFVPPEEKKSTLLDLISTVEVSRHAGGWHGKGLAYLGPWMLPGLSWSCPLVAWILAYTHINAWMYKLSLVEPLIYLLPARCLA